MSADGQTIPDEIASRTARLINEAEDMRQQAADDLKQIYADLREELKALGWDGKHVSAEVAALKGAIAEMRLDDKAKEKREERGERIDDYVSLLTRARAHTRGRKSSGEILDTKLAHTVVTGMQTETGRAALIAAVDIMIAREEAEEHPASDDTPIVPPSPAESEAEEISANQSRANVGEEAADESAAVSDDPASRASEDSERQRASMVGFADDCRTGGKEQSAAAAAPVGDAAAYAHGIPDTFSENDAVAAVATVLPSAERVTPHRSGSAAANAGGDHVTAQPSSAATAGAAVSAAPATRGTVTFEDFPPNPMRRAGFGHCLPELTAREYDALGTSIAFEGVLQPIVRRGDVILDGWARYNIARNLGIQYPVIEYDGDDELLDVIRWQRAARNFTPAQERKIAADLAKEVPHRASEIMAAFEIELEEA